MMYFAGKLSVNVLDAPDVHLSLRPVAHVYIATGPDTFLMKFLACTRGCSLIRKAGSFPAINEIDLNFEEGVGYKQSVGEDMEGGGAGTHLSRKG